MPDITMCRNNTCKDKEMCYRWTAEPSSWQSYAWFDGSSLNNICLDFVAVRQKLPNNPEQQGVFDTINTEPTKVQ